MEGIPLFSALSDSLETAVGVINTVSRCFTLVNPSLESIFSVEPGQLTGMKVTDVFRRYDLYLVMFLDSAVNNRSSERIKDVPLLLDNEYHYYNISFIPVEEDAGPVRLILFMMDDVSARVKEKRKLVRDEKKYRMFFKSIDSGYIICEAIRDSTSLITDYRFREANPAMEDLTGINSDAITGKLASEVWQGRDPAMLNIYNQVMETGQTVKIENYLSRLNRYYDVTVFYFDHEQFAVYFTDITEHRLDESKKNYLLRLTDAIGNCEHAAEIKDTACRLLGEEMNVSRVMFSELKLIDNAEYYFLSAQYTTGEILPSDLIPASDFVVTAAPLMQGELVVINDVAEELPPNEHAVFINYKIRAFIAVPLIRQGRPILIFGVHNSLSRWWTPYEISLVRETAERTWFAIERSQAQNALLESEEKYHRLFDSIDEGVCLIRMIYNEEGKPVDWEYLEVNPTFEKLLDIKPLGKKISEFTDEIEDFWFEFYDNVLRTGSAGRVVSKVTWLGKWLQVYASRVGGDGSKLLSVVFDDITNRVEQEELQKYMFRISETLRSISDPVLIEESITRMAMDYFQADRCYYCTIEGENATIYRDAFKEGNTAVAGTYPLASFSVFNRAIESAAPVIVNDIDFTDLVDDPLREICHSLKIISFIDIPVIKNGKAAGIFCITQAVPRIWTEQEVRLAIETAERTWSAVERARAEMQLINSERMLRKANDTLDLSISAGQIGIWHLDVNADKLYWSKEQCRLYGLEEKELIQTSAEFWNYVSHYDKKRLMRESESFFAEHRIDIVQQFRIKSQDNELRWLESRLRVKYDSLGNPQEITGINIDITHEKSFATELERQVTERTMEMRRQKELIETIINSTPDMIGAYDSETRLITLNKACEKRLGIKVEDAVGRKMIEIFPLTKDTDAERDLLRALAGETVYNEVFHPAGTDRFYENHIIPLFDDYGSVYAAVAIAHDITDKLKRDNELNQKNQELLKMNRELEAFTYISSHDLQEPLRKIQTFASRIMQKETENLSDAGQDYFFRMSDAARRMQLLLKDLLKFSRLASGKRKYEETDLNRLIEEVKNDFIDKISEKKATIECGHLASLKVIEFQFRQLIQNLIGNALKFSNPEVSPCIIITGEYIQKGEGKNTLPDKNSSWYRLTISDNGIGFESQFSEKIFEVFQRLHGKEKYEGTGIGLAIVKKIVENHQGYITANGEPGKGARFDIYLPA